MPERDSKGRYVIRLSRTELKTWPAERLVVHLLTAIGGRDKYFDDPAPIILKIKQEPADEIRLLLDRVRKAFKPWTQDQRSSFLHALRETHCLECGNELTRGRCYCCMDD